MKLPESTRVDLARRRLELGLSQQNLADRLGIYKSRVCQLELGANNPSPELLAKWCAALGWRLSYEPERWRIITQVAAPAPAG